MYWFTWCTGLLLFCASTSSLVAETITGRVTNANTAAALVGFDLDVYTSSFMPVTITGGKTVTNGNFTITVPGPGNYIVRVDANSSSNAVPEPFADQYYKQGSNGTLFPSQATVITVGAGQTASGINIALPQTTVVINGRVQFNGANAASVNMDLYVLNPVTQAREFLSGYPGITDSNGTYQFGYLAPGTYYIRAKPDPATGQFYVGKFYNNVDGLANATPVVVSGSSVSNINFNLTQAGGAISGSVTAQSGGAALVGIDLDLYDSLGNRADVNAVTKADGTYLIGPVPAGNYRLRVDPTLAQGYPRTYYNTIYNLLDAAQIAVGAGATTPGINFVLPAAGSIQGTITAQGSGAPLGAIDLDLYDLADRRVDVTAVSNSSGQYQIGPIAPGSYHLRADPAAKQGYMTSYYDGMGSLATASVITMGSSTLNGINFALAPAGFIEGTVTNTANQPLAQIDLDLFDATTGVRMTVSAATDAAGYYLLGPIPVGSYKLRCDPMVQQLVAVEYANGQLTQALADVLAVPVTGLTVNFQLDPGGSFQGTLLSQATAQPLVNFDLDVYRILGPANYLRMDQSAKSDVNGNWTLGPLPAGDYLIRADGGGVPGYVTTWYGDTTQQAQATPVNFGGGLLMTGLIIHVRSPQNSAGKEWALYR